MRNNVVVIHDRGVFVSVTKLFQSCLGILLCCIFLSCQPVINTEQESETELEQSLPSSNDDATSLDGQATDTATISQPTLFDTTTILPWLSSEQDSDGLPIEVSMTVDGIETASLIAASETVDGYKTVVLPPNGQVSIEPSQVEGWISLSEALPAPLNEGDIIVGVSADPNGIFT